LALDELKFKGKLGVWQCIAKSETRLEKHCISFVMTMAIHTTQYMSGYPRKERASMTAEVIPMQGTVVRLTNEAEGVGHTVFMELFFFAPVLSEST
jgi:hypothetical protein